MMEIKDKGYYLDLITSEYRPAKNFNAVVSSMLDYGIAEDRFIAKMLDMFDVDVALDDQLDILGACVGVSRSLKFEPSPAASMRIICPPAELLAEDTKPSQYALYKTPIPALMGEVEVIAGFAPQEMIDEPSLITDDIYRIMIKARIIQNVWKGNVLDLYDMWSVLFPENQGIQIQDLQDMSFNIVLLGDYGILIQELIMHGYIIPKPEGVRINMLTFISTEGLPIFAYKYNTINYNGYKSHWIQVKEV